MYDYYLFPLPRASKWNRPIFDHSEVKIDLYLLISSIISNDILPLLNYLQISEANRLAQHKPLGSVRHSMDFEVAMLLQQRR